MKEPHTHAHSHHHHHHHHNIFRATTTLVVLNSFLLPTKTTANTHHLISSSAFREGTPPKQYTYAAELLGDRKEEEEEKEEKAVFRLRLNNQNHVADFLLNRPQDGNDGDTGGEKRRHRDLNKSDGPPSRSPPPKEQITKASAFLSFFGSLWIITAVLRDRRKRRQPYHRILLGLSCFDLFSSFFYATTSWFRNSGDDSTPLCVAAGFFTYLAAISVPSYNACLALYFLLAVLYSWRDDRIEKQFERYVHPTISIFGLTVCIIAIPLDLYNPSYQFCSPFNWRPPYTAGRDFYFVLSCAVILLSSLLVTTLMFVLYIKVRKVLQRGNRFSFDNNIAANAQFMSSEMNTSNQNLRQQPRGESNEAASTGNHHHHHQTQQRFRPNNKMAKRVLIMALLYTIPFYVSWVIPVIWHIILTLISRQKIEFRPTQNAKYAMQVYVATTLPLQGFFNWLIFIISTIQGRGWCFGRRRHRRHQNNKHCLRNVHQRLGKILGGMANVSGFSTNTNHNQDHHDGNDGDGATTTNQGNSSTINNNDVDNNKSTSTNNNHGDDIYCSSNTLQIGNIWTCIKRGTGEGEEESRNSRQQKQQHEEQVRGDRLYHREKDVEKMMDNHGDETNEDLTESLRHSHRSDGLPEKGREGNDGDPRLLSISFDESNFSEYEDGTVYTA